MMQIFYITVFLICPIICVCLFAFCWTLVGNSVCSKRIFTNFFPNCFSERCTTETDINVQEIIHVDRPVIREEEEAEEEDKPPSYSSLFLPPKYDESEKYSMVRVVVTNV